MRHTYGPSLSPSGTAIAYIVRDGGYPYAVQSHFDRNKLEESHGEPVEEDTHFLSEERPVQLPVDGPVTRILHSPNGKWVACEASPRGSERLETFVVSTDPAVPGATTLHNTSDAKTTLVEWDGPNLAMDAVAADGVTEARLMDPESSRYLVMDRRSDSLLVAAESGFSLMRVGPRGNRELLLVMPNGWWCPLLTPDPGAATEVGRIFLQPDGRLLVFLATDHHAQRRRLLRLTIELGPEVLADLGESASADSFDDATPPGAADAPAATDPAASHASGYPQAVAPHITRRRRCTPHAVAVDELIASADADMDEFVVSEDLSTAAVLWNQAGVSILEVLTLGDDQQVFVRRNVDLPGLVARELSITDDGALLALTVEGPNLPPSVEILHITPIRIESCNPARSERLHERSRAATLPELVHYTARDGVELSGWLYVGQPASAQGAFAPDRDIYVHLHGGPEGQSRPVNHDVIGQLVAAGITVFLPNIRGSKGGGRAFAHLDDRYGRFAAVDDVADTVQFLLDSELGDQARVFVGGRSYGGYLALLAAARYPGMFAGVIDACGMTSFETYYESTEPWLASAASPKYGYPMHDAELLMEISPLFNVESISAPVLLIHGENDSNVPMTESIQFRDAMLAHHGIEADVLLVTVPGEGHQFMKRKSRALIAESMLEFMARGAERVTGGVSKEEQK